LGSIKNEPSAGHEFETIQQWRMKGKKLLFTVSCYIFIPRCLLHDDGWGVAEVLNETVQQQWQM
jgi:hypothetical protein